MHNDRRVMYIPGYIKTVDFYKIVNMTKRAFTMKITKKLHAINIMLNVFASVDSTTESEINRCFVERKIAQH